MTLLDDSIISSNAAFEIIEKYVGSDGLLQESALVKNAWSSVILPGHLFGNREMAQEISSAISKLEIRDFIALNVDTATRDCTTGYLITSNATEVFEFGKSHSYLSQLFTTANESFVILFGTEDYYIAAGPSDFVKSICGGDINAATERFTEFALASMHISGETEALLELQKRFTIR